MGDMGSSEYVAPADARAEADREELDWLLTSGVLGRSGNLARVLKYVCEERFAGRAHQIKEYTIATEALGRRPDFDPHTDTIVRVTVHALRKRLLEIYQNEGADRPMRLIVPAGHYDPCFVPAPPLEPPPTLAREPEAASLSLSSSTSPVALDRVGTTLRSQPLSRRIQRWSMAGIALSLVIAALTVWGVRSQKATGLRQLEVASLAGAMSRPPPRATIRALMGSGRQPYVDHSGVNWVAGNYCQGGSNVTVPAQRILGTEDAPIYLGGVRGIAHCIFPVTQKLYELHFYFAEASDLQEATRLATLSINAGPIISVDVVDDAGGNGIATSTVMTGVAPENDGSIHVDFTSEISLLNAVELIPAPSASLLPVRIVVSSKPYVDRANQFWASDRYFSGGRYGLPHDSVKQAIPGLYESDRIGRFHYSIPAVPMAHYRVRLYFREPWFGKENGGIGGPGSRVFDVACNDKILMKNFDILAEGGSAPVVKTFEHIQASAGGRIDISFSPVVNYAVINAIEVLPEN
jgi:hypothetical protein